MTIDEIRAIKSDLEIQIHHAAATMELNNNLFQLRDKLFDIQNQCPHNDGIKNYSLEKICPICGKKFKENK